MQPAVDAFYEACCLNDISRLAYYESRLAVNAAGNEWLNPSPFETNKCLMKTCANWRKCTGKCEAGRVRVNEVLCENRYCELCCGKIQKAVDAAGGEWQIDLREKLPNGPKMPALPSQLPALPSTAAAAGAASAAAAGAVAAAKACCPAKGDKYEKAEDDDDLTQTVAPEAVEFEVDGGDVEEGRSRI